MIMTPGESLAPSVLILEQESYLPYIKKVIKHIAKYRPISLLNLNYKTYTTNSQESNANTSVTIIGEHHSQTIKNRTTLLYTLFLLLVS